MKIEDKLYICVMNFMTEQQVTCIETIHQCDRVIENAYEFIGELFKIVEADLPDSYDEEDR